MPQRRKVDLFIFHDVEEQSLLYLAHNLSHIPGTIFLYSGSNFDSSEKSFLWAFPYDTIKVKNGLIQRQGSAYWVPDIWHELRKQVEGGTWAGFFGYEMGFYAEKQLTHLLKSPYKSSIDTDDLYLQCSCFEAIYEHKSKTLQVTINRSQARLLVPIMRRMLQGISHDMLLAIMKRRRPVCPTLGSVKVIKPFESFDSFEQKFEAIHEAIREGNVYQLNLSHEITFGGHFRAFSLFLELIRRNQLSFFSFLRLSEYAIVSASPERFLRRTGEVLETRPIKGTRPRGKTLQEDRDLFDELVRSEKEASELIMIVDLMRNDLSRVAKPGSVEVKELFRIEAYRHIFHRLSVIQAKTLALHPIEVLHKTFPGGSVTGCPKISAMKLIASQEKRRRGIYTGAIGYIKADGDFDFSIAIRTAVVNSTTLTFAVGGGIVIDSEAESEYLETKYKAESMLEVLHANR